MDRSEYADEDDAFVRHLESLGVPHPYGSPDARRIGLDRNTEEGALIAFSSSLRPGNPVHRLVAWVLLASFGLPVVFMLLRLAGTLTGAVLG